jgi:hypothetical protein
MACQLFDARSVRKSCSWILRARVRVTVLLSEIPLSGIESYLCRALDGQDAIVIMLYCSLCIHLFYSGAVRVIQIPTPLSLSTADVRVRSLKFWAQPQASTPFLVTLGFPSSQLRLYIIYKGGKWRLANEPKVAGAASVSPTRRASV